MGVDYPYRAPASELPGTKTLVRPDSQQNLPSDLDREKEVALPAESATPNSPSSGGGENTDDHGGNIPRFVLNRPDNDIDKRPRTLPQPGADYGVPTKYDYNMPTRRSLTAEYALFDWMYDDWRGEPSEEDPRVAASFPKQRQRKQRGVQRHKSRMNYRKNRNKYKQKAKQRYKRNRNKPEYKRKQKMRRQHPQRFKRRTGSVLTAPEIAFLIGREQVMGYVHGVSSLTGMVTFATAAGDWASLPVVVFISSVSFLSEEDIEAMFKLVDVEIGLEAYEDITSDAVKGCAELFGIDWDGDAQFKEHCEALTGEASIDAMDTAQLEILDDSLVRGQFGGLDEGVLEGGGRSLLDDDDDTDPYEIDPMDDALYFGEVDIPDEARVAGEIVLFDQDFDPVQEINHPVDKSLAYQPEGPGFYKRKPEDQHLPAAPGPGIDRRLDDIPPPSSKVVPRGEGAPGFIQGPMTYPKSAAATIPQIITKTNDDIHQRARALPVKLVYASPDKGFWRFEVRGKSGTYLVRIKGIKKGATRYMKRAPVQVSCSCPFWRWQGPEHWAVKNGYLYGDPRGTASVPVIRDPNELHWACKHVLAAFRLARNYRISSVEVETWDLPTIIAEQGIQPVVHGPDPAAVALRWLESIE